MTEKTCINCRWCDTSLYGAPDDDDWPFIICGFPSYRLPSSMSDAYCERDAVHYLHCECPTWEAKE